MKIIGIYTIINLINKKIYIGYSDDINKRLRNHKSALNRNDHVSTHLQNAVNQYGIENFEFDILIECLEDHLASEEHYWCNLLNVHNPDFGYNIKPTHPENRGSISEETRKKMSEGRKGCKNHRFGTKLPKVDVERLRKINKGRVVLQSTKDKIREKAKGRKRSKETQAKLALKLDKYKKKVTQLSKEGFPIKDWNSIKEASDTLKITHSSITRCLQGKLKHAGNFKWKIHTKIN